jgi:hypothetical protein
MIAPPEFVDEPRSGVEDRLGTLTQVNWKASQSRPTVGVVQPYQDQSGHKHLECCGRQVPTNLPQLTQNGKTARHHANHVRAHNQIGVDEHALGSEPNELGAQAAANGQQRRWHLVLTSNGCNPQHLCLVAVELEPVRSYPAGDQNDATCDVHIQRRGLYRPTRPYS